MAEVEGGNLGQEVARRDSGVVGGGIGIQVLEQEVHDRSGRPGGGRLRPSGSAGGNHRGGQKRRQKSNVHPGSIPPADPIPNAYFLISRRVMFFQRTSKGPVPFLIPWTWSPMKPDGIPDFSSTMSATGTSLIQDLIAFPSASTR